MLTKEGNTLKFNNTLGVNIGLTVFGPEYSVVNGYKNMTALEFLSITVNGTEDIEFSVDDAIVVSSKTLEPII